LTAGSEKKASFRFIEAGDEGNELIKKITFQEETQKGAAGRQKDGAIRTKCVLRRQAAIRRKVAFPLVGKRIQGLALVERVEPCGWCDLSCTARRGKSLQGSAWVA